MEFLGLFVSQSSPQLCYLAEVIHLIYLIFVVYFENLVFSGFVCYGSPKM